MDTLWRDIRYSGRMLVKSPGFTLVAVLVLALGIGANTAIFSVVYGALLRPLPYPESDRLMQIVWRYNGGLGNTLSDQQYRFLEENNRSFQSLAAFSDVGFSLALDNAAARVRGFHVSANYFQTLGAQPFLGRDFSLEDDVEGAPWTAVLSHGLWTRQFGGDRSIIGRSILLDGATYTVIGVLPPGFRTFPETEVWTPIAPVAKTIGQGNNYTVVGRLKPEVTPGQAQGELNGLTETYRGTFPQQAPRGADLSIYSYRDLIVIDVRTPLLVLFGTVGFVLLITCANVANLLLARG